ncbi:uroporphyrinogen-III synthase [Roseibium sp.]|uniref:uroporphyrinogen-III synthase n=1 Tax=Roseibium sp. TaxID=1936156 RepID=UPI003A96B735
MRFLLTRPQPECSRTAKRLRELGHDVLESPMLRLKPLTPGHFDMKGVAALAVTSKRIAGLLAAHPQMRELSNLPVFAVGSRTADSMRAAGFEDVVSANGDVAALAEMITAHRPAGTVLYLAARDRAGDLEGRLASCGIECKIQILYAMEPEERLAEDVLSALQAGSIDAVLIYSRRTAQALVDALMAVGRMDVFHGLRVIAISDQSAEPVPVNACVEVAPHPSEDGLLQRALTGC